jgi:hypothetical protein
LARDPDHVWIAIVDEMLKVFAARLRKFERELRENVRAETKNLPVTLCPACKYGLKTRTLLQYFEK